MLCLSRMPGETIVINENIRVTVKSVTGNQVFLGIDAPKEISIHREEVHLRILNEKLKARDRGIIEEKNGNVL